MSEYEASGLTQKEYSKRAGIWVNSLNRWRKKARESSKGVRFVEVESDRKSEKKQEKGYRVEHRNGLSIEFLEGFDSREIRTLIGILKETGKC